MDKLCKKIESAKIRLADIRKNWDEISNKQYEALIPVSKTYKTPGGYLATLGKAENISQADYDEIAMPYLRSFQEVKIEANKIVEELFIDNNVEGMKIYWDADPYDGDIPIEAALKTVENFLIKAKQDQQTS